MDNGKLKLGENFTGCGSYVRTEPKCINQNPITNSWNHLKNANLETREKNVGYEIQKKSKKSWLTVKMKDKMNGETEMDEREHATEQNVV